MISDEYSTDESVGKRKAQEEIEGNFIRSKKTLRTPTKTHKKEEDKLDQILKLMTDMKQDQNEIKTEVKQIRIEQKELNEEIKKLKIENEKLKKENENIRTENKEIKKELREVRGAMETIEKDRKKNNVVMSGLTINSDDQVVLKDATTNFIKQHLKVDINIKNATKLGQKTCLIELENENDKIEVMRNKIKLRELRNEKVFINDDLTKREREKQKQIRLKAQEERQKGKNVKIGYNKITVDGTVWRWNKIDEKLEDPEQKN